MRFLRYHPAAKPYLIPLLFLLAILVGACEGTDTRRHTQDEDSFTAADHIPYKRPATLVEALENPSSHWVDSVFKSLTPEQRIAQLMIVEAFSDKGPKYEADVMRLIKKYKVGGIIFFQGGPMRQAHHIGASGVVYGLAGYLLFRGIFTRDRSALAVAFAVLILYSGLFYGLFPNEERVSWEGHLADMAAGFIGALFYGHKPVSKAEAIEATVKVNADVTQRHVNSTFMPYYLHYTLQYDINNGDKAAKSFVYTLTPDRKSD